MTRGCRAAALAALIAVLISVAGCACLSLFDSTHYYGFERG